MKYDLETGVFVLAVANLGVYGFIAYYFLLPFSSTMWNLGLGFVFLFAAIVLLLYLFAGFCCTVGLLQHKVWARGLSTFMWTLEASFFFVWLFITLRLGYLPFQNLALIFLAGYRIFSIAYLAKKEVVKIFTER